MNILVCAKQVPDTTQIKIDPVTNTLVRDGVPAIMNTFDTFALEMALRYKAEHEGSKLTVISMGPPQAEAILKDAVAVGADEVYLVSGRKFAGSDTLATSYIISEAIKQVEAVQGAKFDIIFCGKQAIDGDTGQVGPETAEHLGYPQITYATEILGGDEKTIRIRKETVAGYETLEANLPIVVSVTKTPFELRLPKVKDRLRANKAKIKIISDVEAEGSVAWLDGSIDWSRCGVTKKDGTGSPTRVAKSFTPVHEAHCNFIESEDGLNVAGQMLIQRLDADAKF